MPIIEYTPQHFEDLQKFVGRLGIRLGLTHRPFVDYYYASSEYCRIYLLLADDGSIKATLGCERMRFEYKGREVIIGAGSNFYSISPGVGGILFVHWLKACPIGLVYGGSPDTHRMIRGRRWIFYEGIRGFILNNPYKLYPGERRWRVGVKSVLRRTCRARLSRYASRIPGEIRRKISVREEKGYCSDLLPRKSPFAFRLAPTVDYLKLAVQSGTVLREVQDLPDSGGQRHLWIRRHQRVAGSTHGCSLRRHGGSNNRLWSST